MTTYLRRWANQNLHGDPVLWGILILLSMMSILLVYSATSSLAYRRMQGDTEYYLIKHGFLTCGSLVLAWLVHRIDYRYFYRISTLLLVSSVFLLLLTLRFGRTVNEATRWISIPFIDQSFQPSDLARLALFIHIAGWLSKSQQDAEALKKAMLRILFWSALVCGLVALTDLSSAILIACISWLLLFMGRVPVRYLFMLAVVVIFTGLVASFVGQRGKTAVHRLEAFFDHTTAMSFQARQAHIAIAQGGWIGRGPSKSEQKNSLPHAYSDFIYAVLIEEYGLLGGSAVLFMYILFVFRASKPLARSPRLFGGLLSISLATAIAVQAFVNMAVSVGLIPVTGLPLPMVSMGGTSQLFMGISVGIILSVSRETRAEEGTLMQSTQ